VASGVDIGANNANYHWLRLRFSENYDFVGVFDNSSFQPLYAGNSKGAFTVCRDPAEANTQRLYSSGTLVASRTGFAPTANLNIPLFEMARNQFGAPGNYSSRQYTYFAVHRGMTAAQAAIYHTAIQTLQVALNRQA
jgi:hypothetical protein